MAAPIATVKVAYYSARAFEDGYDPFPTNGDVWTSEPLRNTLALMFIYPIMAALNSVAGQVIEFILFRNFPEMSFEWVCVDAKGEEETKLDRWQKHFSFAVLGLAALLRWPGGYVVELHLWQCLLIALSFFAAIQTAIMLSLTVLDVFIGLGNALSQATGWVPYPLPAELSDSMFFQPQEQSKPPSERPRFPQSRFPRFVPPSESWYNKSRPYGFHSTFSLRPSPSKSSLVPRPSGYKIFESENAALGIESRYQSLSAKLEYEDMSFEEIRLQHLETPQEQQEREEFKPYTEFVGPAPVGWSAATKDAQQPSGSPSLDNSNVPTAASIPLDNSSWLRIRNFGRSIFSNSTASTASRDTFGYKLGRHGMVPMDETPVGTPNLLTGSPPIGRHFF